MQPISGSGTPRPFFRGDSANVRGRCVRSEGSVEVQNVQCRCTEPETWLGEDDQGQSEGRENVGYGIRKWEAEWEKGRRMRKDAVMQRGHSG